MILSLRERIWARWACQHGRGECWYCGSQLEAHDAWELEHKQPRSRGGSTEAVENFVIACAPCNRRKGACNVEQYRQREWDRWRRILIDAFDITQRLDGFQLTARSARGRRLEADDVIAAMARWVDHHGPAVIKFSGEEIGAKEDQP